MISTARSACNGINIMGMETWPAHVCLNARENGSLTSSMFVCLDDASTGHMSRWSTANCTGPATSNESIIDYFELEEAELLEDNITLICGQTDCEYSVVKSYDHHSAHASNYVMDVSWGGCTTAAPSTNPTDMPSALPTTAAPSTEPTSVPSDGPTVPTFDPTTDPTSDPTSDPTADPTSVTTAPSYDPTSDPTTDPTDDPTNDPTNDPTADPTAPTEEPTSEPSSDPTADPTEDPTSDPTDDPTSDPTSDPTEDPTSDPTNDPTEDPTAPSDQPTSDPTNDPTADPTDDPTSVPTSDPTEDPTAVTSAPSYDPTSDPTAVTTAPSYDPTSDPTTGVPTMTTTSSTTTTEDMTSTEEMMSTEECDNWGSYIDCELSDFEATSTDWRETAVVLHDCFNTGMESFPGAHVHIDYICLEDGVTQELYLDSDCSGSPLDFQEWEGPGLGVCPMAICPTPAPTAVPTTSPTAVPVVGAVDTPSPTDPPSDDGAAVKDIVFSVGCALMTLIMVNM